MQTWKLVWILVFAFRNWFHYLNKWGEKNEFISIDRTKADSTTDWNGHKNLTFDDDDEEKEQNRFQLCWLAAHCYFHLCRYMFTILSPSSGYSTVRCYDPSSFQYAILCIPFAGKFQCVAFKCYRFMHFQIFHFIVFKQLWRQKWSEAWISAAHKFCFRK